MSLKTGIQESMEVYKIKKGFDLPIQGRADAQFAESTAPKSIGVHPIEFKGLKPKLIVQEGDSVKVGSPLFFDKSRPEIQFCSPATGTISEIKYGPRRVIEAIRIAPSETEEFEQHENFRPDAISQVGRENLVKLLLKAGLWPYFRQRPFDIIPDPGSEPASIFVNCMATAPLAADPEFALQGKFAEFKAGMEALKVLCKTVHVVVDGKKPDSEFLKVEGVQKHGFTGPHPAGLVGTHISKIDPITHHKTLWYLNARDVVKLGAFLLVGQYPTERVVCTAGSGLTKRQYFRTVSGASLNDLLDKDIIDSELRYISGDVLTGRQITENDYVGFYDDTITVIPEDRERRFIGWLLPGAKRHTFSGAYISAFIPGQVFNMKTNKNGEKRALVKTGDYEKVTALDVLPDFLVKAILAEDIEMMEQLGILECAPEDFALCTYICPSKTEFTEIIQDGLDLMQKEMS